MSDDKQQRALDAAQDQFLRYGFKRVTMGDIAAAAGISRPALYLLFANKEAIFNGVLERFMNQALGQIEATVAELKELSEQLSSAVQIWTVQPYELLHDTPEGRELADCQYLFAAPLVADCYQRFDAILETIFEPYKKQLESRNLTPAGLAQTFSLSLRGIKAGATDIHHLRTLTNNLIGVSTTTATT